MKSNDSSPSSVIWMLVTGFDSSFSPALLLLCISVAGREVSVSSLLTKVVESVAQG